MAISAKDVKRLRDLTGVGMMDCKKALTETDGDFDAAIDLLRKTGQKVAANRADRDAKEGVIATASSEDGATAILVEVNCETDFVARNSDFQDFADAIAALVIKHQPADQDALLALGFAEGETIGEAVIRMTGKIGEKIDIRRHSVSSNPDGKVVSYIHPGAKLGVLVVISGSGDLGSAGRDVAMQVAALNPIATGRDDVSDTVKEKEMEIAREAAKLEGKPEKLIDRIAIGKLERYYKDNVLLEQPFVKDSSQTVTEMLKGANANVSGFIRFALGG
ncbi:MAG: elongation factor Ts [Rhodothermales bacterium]|jgi:elongation factor Ts